MKELSRTIRSFFAKLNDMEFFGIMWAEILNIVRRGLLLVRDASNSADAEVQREVVIASIVFVSELMIIANNTSTLWNPTWMTLCEFGIKEDFKYDQEEELSRCIVRSLASLWQKTFEDDTTSTPLQTVAGQQAFLEYIFQKQNSIVEKVDLPPNKKLNFEELSMGMSSDYLDAIEFKSTYVRIGSNIFGPRT